MGLPGLCYAFIAKVGHAVAFKEREDELMLVLDGSSENFSNLSRIHLALSAVLRRSFRVKCHLLKTKRLMVHQEPNCTDVLMKDAVPTNDSLDIPTYGYYCRHEEAVQENSQTVLLCFAVLLVLEFDGFGTVTILFGLRSSATTRSDGYMLTLAKNCGICLEFTQKVSRIMTLSNPLLTFIT